MTMGCGGGGGGGRMTGAIGITTGGGGAGAGGGGGWQPASSAPSATTPAMADNRPIFGRFAKGKSPDAICWRCSTRRNRKLLRRTSVAGTVYNGDPDWKRRRRNNPCTQCPEK